MGHPGIHSWRIMPKILCLLTVACDQQGATFKETPDSPGRRAADATVNGQDDEALPPESDVVPKLAGAPEGRLESNDFDPKAYDSALGFDADRSPDNRGEEGEDLAVGTDAGGRDPLGGGENHAPSGSDDDLKRIGNHRVVELIQTAPPKVDLLWVIDVSGSMSEEQQYLGQNFDALIKQLLQAGHNFQVGITSTDVCEDHLPSDLSQRACPVSYGGDSSTRLRGRLVGEPGRRVLKSTDSDIVQRFKQYTSLGVGGSGFEHGLYAGYLAFSKMLTGQNEQLLRSDAFLSVIVVSDEQDDGIGLSETDAYTGRNFYQEGLTRFRYTDDDMLAYLEDLKGAGQFAISTITPVRLADGTLCAAPHTSPKEEGTQYIQAANRSGGIVQSLCDTNWSQSLANLGRDITAQTSQITLPSRPDPATIKVYVDGLRISTWTYISGTNTVKFNPDHVPPEGALMTVRYAEL